uniref:Uncharacterized protein n=1 Tax=Ditylenchus dipsaci TaxID=166011 RepID=A0A915E9U2_9BILA
MPIFGSKEGTPSNGRPGMSAPPAPIRVHHNGGNRPSVPPSSAKIPSSTPLFASMFGISRHKKQNSAPLQTNTTNLPSEYYMDENSNGLQGSYTNGHQKSGTYTSAFHPVGKPPTAVASHSNNHSGLSNNHINRRQSIGGGVEEKQQSTSFFQRLTRRKTPVSISTPSSPASARKHFFSFGSSDNHNRSASNKPVVSKEDVPLANNTRPKSAIPNPQQQQLSFAQRIKLHKGMRTTGKVPFEFMQSSKSQGQLAAQKRQQKDALKREKAFSADALNQMDPVYLTEALLAIGDVQPIVARSIPKHTVLIDDPKKTEERLRRDCLYEDEFYDKMLADSVLVCDLLQTHLSDCIAGVRAKTPTALSSPFTSPPQTPNMSRSQSSQPLFVGERRSVMPSSPPHLTGSPLVCLQAMAMWPLAGPSAPLAVVCLQSLWPPTHHMEAGPSAV